MTQREVSTTVTDSPEETFALGQKVGAGLLGGEILLLHGGLGAGKTLFAKGVLGGLGYDVDEVTSPSFTLVNLYKTGKFDVYHIDFWRLDKGGDLAGAVGISDMLEDESAVLVIEWPERLKGFDFGRRLLEVTIEGDGEGPRKISLGRSD
ncbi:MAG: tRNA (adenosine(37)-N6)-threonylcarbamoyltransferase complex ATPase subunit type 1 TsaE [Acidobacteriota bacterium]